MPVRRLGFAILILISAVSLRAQPLVTGRIIDPSERPLADVRVELLPVPSNFEAGRLRLAGQRDLDPVAEARSDAAGRFLLRSPASGAFRVVVRGERMFPLQYSPLLLVEDEELPPAVLTPDAGARFQVTDPSGHPLAGAWVFAASVGERDTEGRAGGGWRSDLRIGRTGPDGTVTLPRRNGERLDLSILPAEGTEERAAGLEGGILAVGAGGPAVRRLRIVSPQGTPAAGVLVR